MLSTTYEYVPSVQGHRKIIFPFWLLSLSSCGSLTRPYIIDTTAEELPQKEEGTYTVGLDAVLVERLEELKVEHEKRKEEIEKDPRPIWHNGIEYANMRNTENVYSVVTCWYCRRCKQNTRCPSYSIAMQITMTLYEVKTTQTITKKSRTNLDPVL